jgi:hypothetical protein
MATVAVLPPALRAKIDAVARHVRLLRAVRGASVLLLVLCLTGGLALLADAAFDLPWPARAALLAVWSALAVSLTVFGLIVPLTRRLDPETIAAVVEEKFPAFGERLTTAVELSGDTEPYHGSPAFIALLISETEARASRLDFLSAVPARLVWYLAAVAGAVLLLVASPAAVAPTRYGELAQRFFFPSPGSMVGAPFAFEVSPGDTTVAVGRPLTVSVRTRALRDGAALPATCTLVTDDGQGNVRRDRMTADDADAFSFKIDKLPGSLTYHVEADGVRSGTHQVRGIVPVELAADSPVITITPPEYARLNEGVQTVNGLNDLRALQYSQVTFQFRFTRPAVAATLYWAPKSGDRKNAAEPRTIQLDLTEDRLGARVELPAVADATYRVRLEAEEGIHTEPDDRALVVQIDKPPKFVKVAMPDDAKTVLPYERVPVYVELADDFGVEKAEVEYRVNDGPPAFDAIPLWGEGGREAQGQHVFTLSGKVKDGDSVAYRLKVQDNRRVPEAGLTPNVTYYPAEGWRHLTISRNAVPLREQEIVAARDSIDRKLEAIKEDIRKEKRSVYKLQQETRNEDALGAEHAQDLKALQKDNLSIEDTLRDVAQEATDAGLQPVADRARDVADKEMHNSAEDLRTAPKQKTADGRTQRFDDADQQLANALQKLEALKKANDQLAQQRLDQMKLEMAAEREKDLADRAADLAAKDQARDPSAKNEADQLRREQQQAADDLKRITEQSESLKNAMDQANAEKAKELADKAKELAEAQRQLAEAQKETEQKAAGEKYGELAKKQQELAERAAKLAQETKPATRAAKTNPLKPDEAQKAADALKENNLADALRNQDQSARELDRVANDLDRAIDLAKDPREAAKQLARLEDDLQKRMDREAAKPNEKAPLAERMQPLRREQEAIRKAAERLSVPSQNQGAQQDRKDAEQRAADAADALKKADADKARAAMEQTKQALNRLADKLPTLAQRQQQAAREVAELRRQQDDISRQAEQAVRDAEKKDPGAAKAREELAKKLTEAARKQADAAERLGRMDAPNQEARQERVQESLNRALADMMDGRSQDINASQQEARRELERLQQALSGQKPADEQARDLANRQRDLADEAKRAAADPKTTPQKQQELQRKQQQLADEAWALPAPEAPQRKADAVDATRKAADQAKQKPADADTPQRMADAAKALERLADQMGGKEADAARAERLAKKQAEAAAEAERQAKAQPNQAPPAEARQNQQRIADEARQVRGGDDAQAEKKKAADALSRAERATRADDQAKAAREAADAMRRLADKLAGSKEDAAKAEPPRKAAQELAKEQRDLAKATEKAQADAAKKPGDAGKQDLQKAMDQIASQQRKLNDQASKLPASGAQKALEQAREAMNQAAEAAGKNDAAQAQQKQNEAAAALDRVARHVPEKAPASRQAEQQAQAPAEGMPNKQQSEQAKQLAQQQRDLRDAVAKAMGQSDKPDPKGQNAVSDIAKEQQEIAKQAGELAKDVGKEQGSQSQPAQSAQKAAQSAQQAANRSQAGAMRQAQQSGQQTAQELRDLARQMAQTPRGDRADPQAPEPVQQARDLAKRQEELNRRMGEAADDTAGQRAQQRAQQQNLQQQANQLSQDLNRAAQQMNRSPQARQQAQQAAQSGQQAQLSMQQAQGQQQQGNQGQARQSQEQAAQALDRAAEQARQAGEQMAQAAQQGQQPGQQGQQAQTGRALQQAQQQMGQAQQQLGQGRPQGAQQSMQQAAQSLQQAAQSMQQQGQPGKPRPQEDSSPFGRPPEGTMPDLSALNPELKKYAGKRWGEIPGELRTKLIQDMESKFGEDYARRIKLYFEQLAETKKK